MLTEAEQLLKKAGFKGSLFAAPAEADPAAEAGGTGA